MAVTITNAEFNRFWDEVLGDDWFADETDIPDSWWDSAKNGDKLITISNLELGWQGREPGPELTQWITRRDLTTGPNFFTLLRRWRAKQKVSCLTVEIPTERRGEFIKLVSRLGGKLTT